MLESYTNNLRKIKSSSRTVTRRMHAPDIRMQKPSHQSAGVPLAPATAAAIAAAFFSAAAFLRRLTPRTGGMARAAAEATESRGVTREYGMNQERTEACDGGSKRRHGRGREGKMPEVATAWLGMRMQGMRSVVGRKSSCVVAWGEAER